MPEIDWKRAELLIKLSLEEDLDGRGDTTSASIIPEKLRAKAVFVNKDAACVCAGLPVAERVFKALDPSAVWTPKVAEGGLCEHGEIMAEVEGLARALLTAERTALNFLQRLCGVATASKLYQAAAGSRCKVLDTRKTTPGWRNLEKYAVAIGGASNHRIGLYDRIMIKDNHRELAGLEGAGGILRSVKRAKAACPDLEVEVEVDSLQELAEAVESGAEHILLDNMSDEQMEEAVKMVAGRAKLEASGGITLARIPSVAATGVDFVSAGALTHSVRSCDISMDITLTSK